MDLHYSKYTNLLSIIIAKRLSYELALVDWLTTNKDYRRQDNTGSSIRENTSTH